MEVLGRSTINPILFYSGKIAGYTTWVILLLSLFEIDLVKTYSAYNCDKLGIIVLVIGLILIVISLIDLGKSVRIGVPSEITTLKVKGIYRISRNPMYLGFNLTVIASMLYTLNLIVVLIGIYSIIVYHLIIIGEEKFLSNRFGEEYENYKKNVRRYF